MKKVGRPQGLIAYDTFRSIEAEKKGGSLTLNLLRPRVLLYFALMALVGGIMLWVLLQRSVLDINVLRDRNPLFVQLSSGGVRNGYTVKILNKLYDTREFRISLKGLPGGKIMLVGFKKKGSQARIKVVPDNLREIRIYVTVDAAPLAKIRKDVQPFEFIVEDLADGTKTKRATTFRRPPL